MFRVVYIHVRDYWNKKIITFWDEKKKLIQCEKKCANVF